MSINKDTNTIYYYSEIDTFVVEIEFSEKLEYALAFGLLADDMQKAYKVLSDECRKNGFNWMYNELTRWKSRNVMQIRLTKQMLLDSQCKGILLTTEIGRSHV